jgi:hypothetical protein
VRQRNAQRRQQASLDRKPELSYKLAMTQVEKKLNGSTWWRGNIFPRLPLG